GGEVDNARPARSIGLDDRIAQRAGAAVGGCRGIERPRRVACRHVGENERDGAQHQDHLSSCCSRHRLRSLISRFDGARYGVPQRTHASTRILTRRFAGNGLTPGRGIVKSWLNWGDGEDYRKFSTSTISERLYALCV